MNERLRAERLQIMLSPEELTLIDDFRFAKRMPSRASTVRELFRLQKGSVLASTQVSGVQVPIAISGRLIAWGEFQVAGDHLALRIVELA